MTAGAHETFVFIFSSISSRVMKTPSFGLTHKIANYVVRRRIAVTPIKIKE